ncbi:MAG: LON peptidase substrate-binding domain-containing protein, partial [Caldilineaceae bacterium]|nr:LON peptidase substrate-binding domain-containing protein [Caldilineaceae bacterium]
MNYFDYDDWDDAADDQVLYESEEYVNQQEMQEEEESNAQISDDLPVLPLRGAVVYPMMWLPLPIGQERSIRLVQDNLNQNRIIALVTSIDETVEEPAPDQIYRVGTAAQVHRVLRTPDGTIRLLVQGLERIRILDYVQSEPYLRARVEVIPETEHEPTNEREALEHEALMRAVQDLFRQLIDLEPQMPEE